MIVYHKNNVAGFKSPLVRYQLYPRQLITVTSGAGPGPSAIIVQQVLFIGVV